MIIFLLGFFSAQVSCEYNNKRNQLGNHYSNREAPMNTKLIITLVLIALAAIFIVQNAEVVELRFLFWTIAMSRALMFVFLMLIGVGVGWALRGHFLHKTELKDTDESPSRSDT
jgi:uncharacterized integral membrane protein